jgi:arylsulfatase A-like enzyme
MRVSTGRVRQRITQWQGRAWAVALTVAAAAIAVGALTRPTSVPARAAGPLSHPNVVVIETDDQTAESIKVMNAVRSWIGNRGVTFQNSFVNFSKCCPSRATFLTGQYARNHRVIGNVPPLGGFAKFQRLHGRDNLAAWLRAAGYRTALIGKYLNGYVSHPVVPAGWSEWHGGLGGAVYDYTINHNGELVHYGTGPADFKQDVLTDQALRFIGSSAVSEKPFFLWLTYSSPHTSPPDPNPQPPHDCDGAAKPAPRDADAFASEPLPTPPSFNEADVSDKPRAVRRLPKLSAPEIADVTRKYRCALESLLSVDDGVDRVFTRLKAKGELARTYVIFTSDNGFLNGEHRLPEGKVKPYEESIRVPLLIRGPGIPRGKTTQDLAINADLAPTITKLTGATPGSSMDGQSLLPAAVHPRTERGRELLLEAGDFHGIRTQRYAYVEHNAGARELYDLDSDPYELRNVASDPAYAKVKAKLSERLRRLNHCRGDDCHTRPRVKLDLGYEARRKGGRECAANPIRVRVGGDAAGNAVKTEYYLEGKRLGEDNQPPFLRVIPPSHGPTTIGIRITMLDGRRMALTRTIRACG